MKRSHVIFPRVFDGAGTLYENTHQILELVFLLSVALDHIQETWTLFRCVRRLSEVGRCGSGKRRVRRRRNEGGGGKEGRGGVKRVVEDVREVEKEKQKRGMGKKSRWRKKGRRNKKIMGHTQYDGKSKREDTKSKRRNVGEG